MGPDDTRGNGPSIDGMSIEQVDAEQERLHQQITILLERVSELAAIRSTLVMDGRRNLSGARLAAVAFSDASAAAQLRAITRATHPHLIDIQRYSADVSGMTPSWAPVALPLRNTPLEEAAGLASAILGWFRLHEPNNPIEESRAKEARHFNHTLIDLRGNGVDSRPRAQIWVRRDADEAFLVDVGTLLQRHEIEGTLAEVLAAGSSLYFCD